MKALSLFSGIGGIDLACEWAGIETVAFCEIDPFCRKVLAKHWPGVPCFEDVTKLKGSDVGTVDIVTGGFPCQDASLGNPAGKGLAGARTGLWFEMLRLVRELRPSWLLAENVPGIWSRGADRVCSYLEEIGFTVWPLEVEAATFGADFEGARVFFLATSYSKRRQREFAQALERKPTLPGIKAIGGYADWANRRDLFEPKLYRDRNGVPGQVDRLRALGNAVVPHQVYPILKAIKTIHDQTKDLERCD